MGQEEQIFGYAGEILRVNLTTGKIYTEPTLKYARDYIGASGIAVKILYDELRDWVTPYDPANKLIFGTGALQGTTAPGACKMNVSSLGPHMGGWATGCSDSYVGGQLKYCGYDSIVFEGRAYRPVYLWIENDKVEIRDAGYLWGKTTGETLDALREETSDPRLHTVSIGPAGERLVRGACIIQDRNRAFGRCGLGAVMGSKNLKAVVARGKGSVKVARPKEFMATVAEVRKMFDRSEIKEKFRKYGTLFVLPRKQEVCGLAYKNFQEVAIPDAMVEAINPMTSIDKYQVSNQSFPGCVIGCSRNLRLTDGPWAGLETGACQQEVVNTLQTRLAIWEPTFMFKANSLCNSLGVDVDAAGGAIGWAMECFQRGIIDERDTDGLKLEWGDAEVAIELIRRIGYREGFGDLLAEGCARAADLLGRGSSYYAMHIKGMDLYEPCRGSNGWMLGTITSTRGGGHTSGALVTETSLGLSPEKGKEVYGVDNIDKPLEYEGKPEAVHYMEAVSRMANCMGICLYSTTCLDLYQTDLPQMAALYSDATGWDTSVDDLKHIAMRQLNLEKAFNLRFTKFDRKDDMPTPRDWNEPIPTGNLSGWKIDHDKFNKMLDRYYELHDWDKETSYPTRKALESVELGYVADDLERLGKLG
jgi:aldehyde:ferredoxin oxidoreductase